MIFSETWVRGRFSSQFLRCEFLYSLKTRNTKKHEFCSSCFTRLKIVVGNRQEHHSEPYSLKYTWEISETSLAVLDIKVSISGNSLCTSVHYKPTDSHSYLLHSSSHPSHVKNSIPYSQFLRLRRLWSNDSDFSKKSKEMCQFFEKRGYPASVIQAAHHRAQ